VPGCAPKPDQGRKTKDHPFSSVVRFFARRAKEDISLPSSFFARTAKNDEHKMESTMLPQAKKYVT
jgi:hypothetical protein